MIPYSWLEQAVERIASHIQVTPLTYDPNNDLYLKWENHQVTGSFKARGALNKVLALEAWEAQRGLVAASAGNHGQGVALAGQLVGAPVTIFASDHAVPSKVDAMRALGAKVLLVPGGYGDAEKAGLAFAQEKGATWVSPYNDGQVIAGQGTLALEILQQLPALPESTWIVPVGGGGLISGIGAALDEIFPGREKPRLMGAQSEASPFAHAYFHTGSQAAVQELPSLADGLAGPIEEGSLTVPIMKRTVSDVVLVSEEEIGEAIAYAWNRYQERLEGSAAVALAAALYGKVKARPAVAVLTGGNIQAETHERVVAGRRREQAGGWS